MVVETVVRVLVFVLCPSGILLAFGFRLNRKFDAIIKSGCAAEGQNAGNFAVPKDLTNNRRFFVGSLYSARSKYRGSKELSL
jgi:hypothetical protein